MLPTRSRGTTVVLALAVLLAVPALAGCVGSDAPSGSGSPAGDAPSDSADPADEVDDGADDADEEVDDGEDEAGEATDPSSVPSRLSFGGCDAQIGVFHLPADLAAEMAPSGFTPTSVLLPGDATASLIVDAHGCDAATSDAFDAPVDDANWVVYLLAVDPPEEYQQEGVDNYFILLGTVTTSPETVEVIEDWGIPAEEGTVDLTATTTPAGRNGQLEVRSDNVSSTLHTVVQPEGAGDDVEEDTWNRKFAISDEDEVTGVMDINVTGHTAMVGGSERVVEPDGTDPGALPDLAVKNAATTGLGLHFVARDGFGIDLQPFGLSGGTGQEGY